MNLVTTVAEITAPAFLLAVVGFVWVRLKLDYPVAFITRLVMNVAIPALIFSALVKTELSPNAMAQTALAAILCYVAVSVLAFGLVKFLGLEIRDYAAPLAYGNTGNLGLPLALFAFGNQGLELALVVFAISGIFTFTIGVWLTSGISSPARLLREPMIVATFAGSVFLWWDWDIPVVAIRSLDLAGQLSIPLMLITLGVAIARLNIGNLTRAFYLSIGKWLLCFVTAWAIGRLFGLSQVAFGVLVLQLCTPVAVTSYLLAEKYGADSQAVAGLVLVSTLISVITLPLTLAFLI